MSSIAVKVRTSQDTDGMLRRALERIIQLYTDKSHFVYELLQNAEDAEAKKICFVQYFDRLEVLHDGKPFTTANLNGLCDIGKSDKVDNLNKIGEFGVGFKSVFGICETVLLYSEPSHYKGKFEEDAEPFAVRIEDFVKPEDIPEEELPEVYTTRFVFPFAVGESFSGFQTLEQLRDTLERKLQNLGITTLLFMKHLELIEYTIIKGNNQIKGEYLLDKQIINDHCQLISALGSSGADTDEDISYLKFSRKIQKYPQRTVDIAFPVRVANGEYHCVKSSDPFVSVYFPTETESKLDFIVQGPFRTTPNRSSIPADDEDNKMLAAETASLLRSSLIELRDMKKLNMSFVRVLPLNKEQFNNFALFAPLYETVRSLFKTEAIIPSASGDYVYAKCAKIARQEKLAALFTDELLTQLINDSVEYHWLPTFLTATSKEYEQVFRYLSGEMNITVIPPENLRTYFEKNPDFLPSRDNDWLVELYSIFENVTFAFSKAKFEANMLTTAIVKTSTGEFVAPYRREGRSYILNVFLTSQNLKSSDIHFVDEELYKRCRNFFDNVLSLEKPNEYEYTIRDIEKRYRDSYVFDEEKHIADMNALIRYYKNDDYRDEVKRIIREVFVLKCDDGVLRSSYENRLYLPISSDGINIKAYYTNVIDTVFFIDLDYYKNYDIKDDGFINIFNVNGSLLVDETIIEGIYNSSGRGNPPRWSTTGDFRWKLSLDALSKVLGYISVHPNAKDSMLKSKSIMQMLLNNETKLCGEVHINGNNPNLKNEPCEMIHILRGERNTTWNRRWLYTESLETVAAKDISKHDISVSIYGSIKPDSKVYELLGFKKTEADKVDELKKSISKEQLDALFESELKQRYGITTADLNQQYCLTESDSYHTETEVKLPFPTADIKNIEALKKHAAEMLIYADPVTYQERVRKIRTSNHPKETRAYLSNMYRYNGTYRYACQLCHEPCADPEAVELFPKPDTELDPMNLFLCPNCAAAYRRMRNDTALMETVENYILGKDPEKIKEESPVYVPLDDDDALWFTQTHYAEIYELMKLKMITKDEKIIKAIQEKKQYDEGDESGLSVYKQYIGKVIRRKDGFEGAVYDADEQNLFVHVTKGKDAGTDKKIQISFLIKNPKIYSVE